LDGIRKTAMPRLLKTLEDRISALGRTIEEKHLLARALQRYFESEDGQTIDQDAVAYQGPEHFNVPRSFVLVVLAGARLLADHHTLGTKERIEVADQMNNALWRVLLDGIAQRKFV